VAEAIIRHRSAVVVSCGRVQGTDVVATVSVVATGWLACRAGVIGGVARQLTDGCRADGHAGRLHRGVIPPRWWPRDALGRPSSPLHHHRVQDVDCPIIVFVAPVPAPPHPACLGFSSPETGRDPPRFTTRSRFRITPMTYIESQPCWMAGRKPLHRRVGIADGPATQAGTLAGGSGVIDTVEPSDVSRPCCRVVSNGQSLLDQPGRAWTGV